MELQQPGDAERASLCAAQRVEQQLSAQRALPLRGPHVNLLRAGGTRAVLPILTLLTLLHLCRTQRGERVRVLKENYKNYLTAFGCH